jgi:hypothetical protein
MIHYVEFRRKFGIVFTIPFLGLFLVVLYKWREAIFYIAGGIYLFFLLESILVKCPQCNKRPINLLKQFPLKCPHCGNDF